ncbi:hypothetical protein BDY17DRAFT_56324 [Neohortaea acidophila]|uniref:Uncharacterized protein n=1 Tax=Neohortaea acidophila TaxID=245834 RepID=A0A6A6PHB7_9PEZI|nr:uncharacterized protein BDY17DRAFT_56324 [Neohortaea acidophila]KAF2478667.1 hypothetical protein BDY17DRAFT_56324 [Neohortaea acidophila]
MCSYHGLPYILSLASAMSVSIARYILLAGSDAVLGAACFLLSLQIHHPPHSPGHLIRSARSLSILALDPLECVRESRILRIDGWKFPLEMLYHQGLRRILDLTLDSLINGGVKVFVDPSYASVDPSFVMFLRFSYRVGSLPCEDRVRRALVDLHQVVLDFRH